MYNDREKLLHHRQLLSENEAAADLELLKRLKPNHPRLAEFGFSPKRSAGDILLELLDVAHRDDIVKNRLQAHKPETPEEPVAPAESGTIENSGDTTEGLVKENQELQDQLEEKEDEISDLQDQLDEKDEKISDLEEQLAEEKKSETPVKAPAKKTAAKKATAKKSGSKKN